MINVVAIMGRLTYDPELRTTPTGVSVVRFQVAVDRNFQRAGEERKADFIDVTAWRQTAEFVSKYFRKGSMIAVEGSIQTDNFTDKDGNKRKSVQVVASNVSFCGSKAESGTTGANSNPAFAQPAPSYASADNSDFEEIVDDVEAVMKESVAMHKISDVEVASYLSSGVDSSYLTYLGQVDRTFTVGFDEGKYSEIQDAKEFAASINMKNDAKVITPEEYWDRLSDIQYYMDEPVADPAAIALYFLSEEASKKVKVVLSGEGSDELFGGYNIYCEPLEHTSFNKIPMPIRRFLGAFAERCLPRGMKGRGFLMRHGKTLEERYFANATNIFTEREANKILKNGCKPGIQKITKPLYDRVKGKDPVTKMQYVDLHLWLVHDILMKGDKMGMANSLEVRVPFLDKKVLELAETLPLDYKVRAPQTKVALRAAAERNIRSKTAEKKKLGFPIPIRVWLKEDRYYSRVKEMFQTDAAKKFFDTKLLIKMLDDHKAGKNSNEKTDNSRKIWTVYIFLVWYDRYFGHGKPVHPAMHTR